mmetsp:Transcript_3154/g.7523  ORF Transcript_3154/g.7523 Transcript_3154/m.7523 type:complete len:238 (+) Transcript_3154:525-1238(+)
MRTKHPVLIDTNSQSEHDNHGPGHEQHGSESKSNGPRHDADQDQADAHGGSQNAGQPAVDAIDGVGHLRSDTAQVRLHRGQLRPVPFQIRPTRLRPLHSRLRTRDISRRKRRIQRPPVPSHRPRRLRLEHLTPVRQPRLPKWGLQRLEILTVLAGGKLLAGRLITSWQAGAQRRVVQGWVQELGQGQGHRGQLLLTLEVVAVDHGGNLPGLLGITCKETGHVADQPSCLCPKAVFVD